jgi:phosphonopyruvate decarboxylase
VTENLLEAMEIPSIHLSGDPGSLDGTMEAISRHFAERSGPLAVIVPKDCFTGTSSKPSSEYTVTREDAIAQVLPALNPADIVVSTTGMISRELFELRERRSEGHDRDFMLVGGMGHTCAVALAVAQARPATRVICLDGDGSVLMHMGSMAVGAQSGSRNLRHIVLNNGAHDSVGGQPTIAFEVDLCGVARSMGYASVSSVSTAAALTAALPAFLSAEGPGFLEVRVRKGARADLGRPTSSPIDNKRAFMHALGIRI